MAVEGLAWVAVAAFTAVAIGAMILLAGPIGDLIAPTPLDFFDEPLANGLVAPEHAELVRVAMAILAALGAGAVVAYAPQHVLGPRLAAAGPALGAIGATGVLAVLLIGWVTRSEPDAQGIDDPDYFTAAAGMAALAFAALVLWFGSAPGRERLRHLAGVGAWLRRRPVALATAVLLTAVFLLPAVFTGGSLPDANPFIVQGHLPGIFGDFTAVADGRTPGVDFAAQYTALLPYALWPVLAATDYSGAGFTIVATCLSAAAMLSVWRLLVLVSRDELAGLTLYVPVIALSVVPLSIVGDERLTNASQYQLLPERYLLPLLTAWVLARHVRGLAPRRPEVPIALAAVAAANNPEFGIPCLLATVVALALARRGEGTAWGELWPLLARAAGAVVAVGALICAIDLVRTGSLPTAATVLYYSRLFGSQGFGMIPMPVLGFHLVLYATFAASLILAAVRARSGEADRGLTALLGYAGAFGLVALVYYGGRSNGYSLIGVFPAWGLALALLTYLVARRINGAAGIEGAVRRAGLLGICALAGFGLAVTTVVYVPAPWQQLSRLADTSDKDDPFDLAAVERFVGDHTTPDESIAVIGSNGFLIAHDVGVTDVSNVEDPVHFVAGSQVQDVIDALDAEGGQSIFVRDRSFPPPVPSVIRYLTAAGFRPVAHDRVSGTTLWQR